MRSFYVLEIGLLAMGLLASAPMAHAQEQGSDLRSDSEAADGGDAAPPSDGPVQTVGDLIEGRDHRTVEREESEEAQLARRPLLRPRLLASIGGGVGFDSGDGRILVGPTLSVGAGLQATDYAAVYADFHLFVDSFDASVHVGYAFWAETTLSALQLAAGFGREIFFTEEEQALDPLAWHARIAFAAGGRTRFDRHGFFFALTYKQILFSQKVHFGEVSLGFQMF